MHFEGTSISPTGITSPPGITSLPASDPALWLGSGSGDDDLAIAAIEREPPVPELPVIQRLRSEGAPLAEWRREALARHTEGEPGDFGRILEAGLEADRTRASLSERVQTILLLAAHLISRALVVADKQSGHTTSRTLLEKARELFAQADILEPDPGGNSASLFTAKGFHSLTSFLLDQHADDLRRAEMLFETALRIDGTSPRALLGKAIVSARSQRWDKSLGPLRQVLNRASSPAPRSGVRYHSLNDLRFAIAACFCNLGRFEQMRNALLGVVNSDPKAVESLCALAHLEAKSAGDGVGKSMEYLDKAVMADQDHPVVLLQLANHAFYCGLEGEQDENGGPAPFESCENLLQRALATTRSSPVRADAWFQMGRLRHAQGRYAEAYAAYSKCKAENPEHTVCLYQFAQTCVQQQRLKEAAAALETLRRLKGDVPEPMRLLCYVYVKLGGKGKQSLEILTTLLKEDPQNLELHALQAEAQMQIAEMRPDAKAHKAMLEAYERSASLLEGDTNSVSASPQMWNNLGTLRGLSGDSGNANKAFERGIDLADQQLRSNGLGTDEAKDLHIARVTLRFNRAWLAEASGDNPNYMESVKEYLGMREEHQWYVDTLLQLGSEWLRVGDVERGVQSFQEAGKQNPVIASLMSAQAYKQQGMLPQAIEAAESAVKRADSKQFHYVRVYVGNLYYEMGCLARSGSSDKDKYMLQALHNFTEALKVEKDSHYAANGIGMVFAHRGKNDFARRTFQSVIQHNAMNSDPSCFVNLGHTYLKSGGDNVRKAIALYEKARKLKPEDLSIRLYLAKGHFTLEEYERCSCILSDAVQIWPDDLLLRFNLAIAQENWASHLVSMNKESKQTAAVSMQQMKLASDLLLAAERIYRYVESRWAVITDTARRALATASGAPFNLTEEIENVHLHAEYCEYLRSKADVSIATLKNWQESLEARMKQVVEEKKAKESVQKQQEEKEKNDDFERALEMEDNALKLMKDGAEIQLGKHLEKMKLVTEPKAKAVRPVKAPKAPKGFTEERRMFKDGEFYSKEEFRQKFSEALELPEGESLDEEAFENEWDGAEVEQVAKKGAVAKRDKKEKKKKDKKKKEKKDKKRRRGSDSEDGDDGPGDEQGDDDDDENKDQEEHAVFGGEAADGETGVELPLKGDEDEEEAIFGDPSSDEGKKEKKKKDKKKKDKKKDKKEKKDKKKKRKMEDGSSEDDEKGDEGGAVADGGAMEDELFGSPDRD
eukprot:TRINITY_DN2021_c0_g1_i1.p1 TRINITY_DN2021_c0_g1~~TRINITY_DN2021_c0_g1_i1.p1  ORF type:complete len:1232 (-),score=257.27 TRINITY_DN2021_c0_g1_i1:267-3962(-)